MASFDTIIRNGTIVDGTGLPRYVDDLAIADGKVAQIGGLKRATADREIDAHGLIVAPGFIDTHTHYDAQLYWDPYCTISGWHGVTTVAIGNCGFGFAPCRPEDRDRSMLSMTRNEQISLEAMQAGLTWDWESFGEFLESVDRLPKGVNVISYAPLTPIMVYAMGGYDEAKARRPNADEIEVIKGLIHDCMDAGAVGFSFQRLGENSVQPDFDGTPMITDIMTDEEAFAFAEVLGERGEGSIQLTYAPLGDKMDNIGDAFGSEKVFNFEERIAEITGRPIVHNIIFAIEGVPELHQGVLAWMQSCWDRGLQIYGQGETNRNYQQFNWLTWNGFDIAPAWKAALMGTPEERLANLRDPEHRAAMVADRPWLMPLEMAGMALPTFEVVSVPDSTPHLKDLEGKTFQQISDEQDGKDLIELMIDLAIETELLVEMKSPIVRLPSVDGTVEMTRSGKVFPGISDGGAHTKFFVGGSFTTDFLTWMVRDAEALSLEEAHVALSALPARAIGLKDRGVIREGAPADIVVYDLENLQQTPSDSYETVHDLPGGDWRRIRRSEGYRYTIVNGEVTFEDSECTGATPGTLVRHGRG
ncbi:MAG: amidohydrolase family protein [Actinomycetota bacterium]